ncbi:MAG: hypothetical protein AAF351_00595 [Pseudomonadota bacterium]
MPEIIPLGWFHTFNGVVALVTAIMMLVQFKEISSRPPIGMIYTVTTLITAATALMIYQHGVFSVAHVMGVAALIALAGALVADRTKVFGSWSRPIRAVGFSATVLFHCLPAVTDALLRLPPSDPMLTSIEDPIMKGAHLTLMVLFLVGVTLQLIWIKRNPARV